MKSVSMAGKLLQFCTTRPPLMTSAGSGISRPVGFPAAEGRCDAVYITAAGPPAARARPLRDQADSHRPPARSGPAAGANPQSPARPARRPVAR